MATRSSSHVHRRSNLPATRTTFAGRLTSRSEQPLPRSEQHGLFEPILTGALHSEARDVNVSVDVNVRTPRFVSRKSTYQFRSSTDPSIEDGSSVAPSPERPSRFVSRKSTYQFRSSTDPSIEDESSVAPSPERPSRFVSRKSTYQFRSSTDPSIEDGSSVAPSPERPSRFVSRKSTYQFRSSTERSSGDESSMVKNQRRTQNQLVRISADAVDRKAPITNNTDCDPVVDRGGTSSFTRSSDSRNNPTRSSGASAVRSFHLIKTEDSGVDNTPPTTQSRFSTESSAKNSSLSNTSRSDSLQKSNHDGSSSTNNDEQKIEPRSSGASAVRSFRSIKTEDSGVDYTSPTTQSRFSTKSSAKNSSLSNTSRSDSLQKSNHDGSSSTDNNEKKIEKKRSDSVADYSSSSFHIIDSGSGRSGHITHDDSYETIFDPTIFPETDDISDRDNSGENAAKDEDDALMDTVVDSSPPVKSEIGQDRPSKKARGENLGIKRKGKNPKTGYPNQGNDYRATIRKICRKIETASGKLSIRADALEVMNNLASDVCVKIATESSNLLRMIKRKTLTDKTVSAATNLVLVGDLAVHAAQAASKALATTKLSRQ